MKRVAPLLLFFCSMLAIADPFVPGQVLTASQLNAALAVKTNVADLAATSAGKGAALVGFKPVGTGAVATTAQNKLTEVVSVKDFGAGSGGDDLAKFNAAATVAGTNGQVTIPPGAYSLSGTTTAITWLVNANATFSGAGVLGGRIVKLGNGGVYGHASKFGSPTAWLEAERTSTENAADLISLSSIGQIGVLGGSRSSDFPIAGSMGSIGIVGYEINDNATAVQSGYAGYFEARRKTGAGTTQGVEIDIVNQDPVTVINQPYQMGATGSTLNLWLASGGEIAATPASLAIGIINNGTTFEKGIVFGATAISGTDGVTGTGTAIGLAKGHTLQWYGAGGAGIGYINNTVATSANRTNLNFSDTGAAITGDSNQILSTTPNVASAVNHLRFNAATTGQNIQVVAEGSDANIGITLGPKGTGTVMSTGGIDAATSGHLWGNIASGTLPGDATTTGSTLIGWNRSASGGEMNFVNAKGAGGTGGFDWRIWDGMTDTKVASIDASGNFSGNRLISRVATGTAPLTVTSTTPVANLSVGGSAGSVPWSGVTATPTTLAGYGITATSAQLATALTDETGTGRAVFATSPTLVTPVISSIVNTGTLTLPTSTDTLVGKATTDTLTNKTFDTAGTGNAFKINGVAISTNTGTGANVLATSPTLVTPNIGAATATSIVNSGVTNNTGSNAAIEHGAPGSVNTPFIDFHSAGTANDYDVRIIASGGAAGSGAGTLAITAATVTHSGALGHGAQEIDTSYTYNVPTTGQTVTLAAGTQTAIINPAGPLAALTVTLPACNTAYNGSLARFSSEQAVTVLTVNATSGTVVGGPTSLALGAGSGYICRGSDATWYRLY